MYTLKIKTTVNTFTYTRYNLKHYNKQKIKVKVVFKKSLRYSRNEYYRLYVFCNDTKELCY